MVGMQQKQRRAERGAVALFIVIFTSLLVTTITVSFIQLMVKDQQQATYSDLSESAYDSAMAGVEDAKRALLMRLNCSGVSSTDCDEVNSAINDGECNTLSRIFLGDGSAAETIIQQHAESDRKLDQAYTCVKITPDTMDFVGTIESPDTATLIPLRGTAPFDTIVVRWHQIPGGGNVNRAPNAELPVSSDSGGWPDDRPALLRAQLINRKGGADFNLSDFDSADRSNTLFLYPAATVNPLSFNLDGTRRTGIKVPQATQCKASVLSGDYACEAAIEVGNVIQPEQQATFLNLMAFYGATNYQVELRQGATPVRFSGVQPSVDSTGRANDLFRRVVSRVELNNTFRYPVAALETSGNLCKTFSVTNEESGYSSGSCEP